MHFFGKLCVDIGEELRYNWTQHVREMLAK